MCQDRRFELVARYHRFETNIFSFQSPQNREEIVLPGILGRVKDQGLRDRPNKNTLQNRHGMTILQGNGI
jgi:hypothetical protein